MVNEEKVILMAKLAVLDKKHIQKDLRVTQYYPEDYVYMNNLKTRISMLVIVMMGIGVDVLMKLERDIVIPTNGRELFVHYILPYGALMLLVLGVYTLISTTVYRRRYKAAQKRVSNYHKLMKELDTVERIEEEERRRTHGKRKTSHIESQVH